MDFSTCILQGIENAAFFGGLQIIMILQYLPLRYLRLRMIPPLGWNLIIGEREDSYIEA